MLWKTLSLKKDEYFRSWAICLFACFVSYMIPALFADTTFGPVAIDLLHNVGDDNDFVESFPARKDAGNNLLFINAFEIIVYFIMQAHNIRRTTAR